MPVADHTVEQRTGLRAISCAGAGDQERQVLIDKALDRVEILDARGLQDVRDLSRVVAREPPCVQLAFQRGWNRDQENALAAAILRDLPQPVLALVPVSLAAGDLEDVAEVIGEEAEHDELGPEASQNVRRV